MLQSFLIDGTSALAYFVVSGHERSQRTGSRWNADIMNQPLDVALSQHLFLRCFDCKWLLSYWNFLGCFGTSHIPTVFELVTGHFTADCMFTNQRSLKMIRQGKAALALRQLRKVKQIDSRMCPNKSGTNSTRSSQSKHFCRTFYCHLLQIYHPLKSTHFSGFYQLQKKGEAER